MKLIKRNFRGIFKPKNLMHPLGQCTGIPEVDTKLWPRMFYDNIRDTVLLTSNNNSKLKRKETKGQILSFSILKAVPLVLIMSFSFILPAKNEYMFTFIFAVMFLHQ